MSSTNRDPYAYLIDQLTQLPCDSRRWALFLATSLCLPTDLLNSDTSIDGADLCVDGRRVPLSRTARDLLRGSSSGLLPIGADRAGVVASLSLDLADLGEDDLVGAEDIWGRAVAALARSIDPQLATEFLAYAGVLPGTLRTPVGSQLVADHIDWSLAKAGYSVASAGASAPGVGVAAGVSAR